MYIDYFGVCSLDSTVLYIIDTKTFNVYFWLEEFHTNCMSNRKWWPHSKQHSTLGCYCDHSKQVSDSKHKLIGNTPEKMRIYVAPHKQNQATPINHECVLNYFGTAVFGAKSALSNFTLHPNPIFKGQTSERETQM